MLVSFFYHSYLVMPDLDIWLTLKKSPNDTILRFYLKCQIPAYLGT